MQVASPDPDLWGHIRFGQFTLQNGQFLWTDPYSYTLRFHEPINPGYEWVRHAWFSQILIAFAWTHWGALGLWLFRLLLVAGLLACILRVGRATTRNLLEVVVMFTLAWGGIAPVMAFRPQLFTFFLFTLLLALISRTHLTRSLNPAWTLAWVPLMLLWANTHGGFLAGLVVIGLLTGVTGLRLLFARQDAALADSTRRLLVWTAAAFLASALVTLINPYGRELYRWLWFDQTTPRPIVMAEWVPLKFFTSRFPYVDVDFPFFKVILLISAGSLIFTRRRRDAFEVLLLAGLVIGGLVHIRHTVFFCIAAAMFIPKHLESAIRARWTRGNSPPLSHLPLPPPNLPGRRAQRVMKAALVLALLLGVTAAGALYGVYTPWRIPMKTAHFPMRAVQFIRDNGIRGNLAVWFNWAQFVLWHLGPDSAAGKPAHNLLAYDGRYRNVYPPGAEQAYMVFHYGKAFLPGAERISWNDLLDRYPTDVVLMGKKWPMLDRMKTRTDFALIYASPLPENAVIFIRRNRYPGLIARARRGGLKTRPLKPVFSFPGN